MPSFDPSVHLAYVPPSHRVTMSDIGLGHLETISEVAITEPFPLLSLEGVKALREEIFSKPVLDNYLVSSDLAACQIRGMASDVARFTAALWTHPETLKACSEAAGMDLVPIMSYELGHVNVQVTDGSKTLSKLGRDPLPALLPSDLSSESSDDDDPKENQEAEVVKWHRDSYPWVCVVMLSDASTMKGGETALECGDGRILKVRGPQIGSAVMMQGKYIKHMAMNAYNAPERVTMARYISSNPVIWLMPLYKVTSFRARDSSLDDESVLTTVRNCSDVHDLYHQWAVYRLKLLADRFQMKHDELLGHKAAAGPQKIGAYADILQEDAFKAWMRKQVLYLQRTIDEIV